MHVRSFVVLWTATLCFSAISHGEQQVGFREEPGRVVITVDDQLIATYVYSDEQIPRPYFAHVNAPGGVQVTRNHPPLEGVDKVDHATMHPGIWMAFGDLSGEDFWRNKAKIVHQRFIQEPTGATNHGSFVEEKHYLRPDGSVVCRETFCCGVYVREDGYLLTWDSTFRSDQKFYFGDQEEMGLGIRLATPISEENGGQLTDSESRKGANRIWSNSARWCDYSGTVDGEQVGMTILCHPDNFRPSWMHARDYGFVAANPFGRNAMKKGDISEITVAPGEKLRLRYGILIHGGTEANATDLDRAYAEYVELTTGAPSCSP